MDLLKTINDKNLCDLVCELNYPDGPKEIYVNKLFLYNLKYVKHQMDSWQLNETKKLILPAFIQDVNGEDVKIEYDIYLDFIKIIYRSNIHTNIPFKFCDEFNKDSYGYVHKLMILLNFFDALSEQIFDVVYSILKNDLWLFNDIEKNCVMLNGIVSLNDDMLRTNVFQKLLQIILFKTVNDAIFGKKITENINEEVHTAFCKLSERLIIRYFDLEDKYTFDALLGKIINSISNRDAFKFYLQKYSFDIYERGLVKEFSQQLMNIKIAFKNVPDEKLRTMAFECGLEEYNKEKIIDCLFPCFDNNKNSVDTDIFMVNLICTKLEESLMNNYYIPELPPLPPKFDGSNIPVVNNPTPLDNNPVPENNLVQKDNPDSDSSSKDDNSDSGSDDD